MASIFVNVCQTGTWSFAVRQNKKGWQSINLSIFWWCNLLIHSQTELAFFFLALSISSACGVYQLKTRKETWSDQLVFGLVLNLLISKRVVFVQVLFCESVNKQFKSMKDNWEFYGNNTFLLISQPLGEHPSEERKISVRLWMKADKVVLDC